MSGVGIATTKQCKKCKEVKAVEWFYRQTKASDGYARLCKICQHDYRMEWRAREASKALEREQKRRARAAMPNEHWNALMKKWRRDNPEKASALDHAFYSRHRERLRTKQKEAYARDPEHARLIDRLSRRRRFLSPDPVKGGGLPRYPPGMLVLGGTVWKLAAKFVHGDISEKKCLGCLHVKEIHDFPNNKKFSDGYDSRCRACYRQKSLTWRSKNAARQKWRPRRYFLKKGTNYGNATPKYLLRGGNVSVRDAKAFLATQP